MTSDPPKIRIPILQIFVFICLKGDKKTFFIGPPSTNENKDLENWNSNFWSVRCREQDRKFVRKADNSKILEEIQNHLVSPFGILLAKRRLQLIVQCEMESIYQNCSDLL